MARELNIRLRAKDREPLYRQIYTYIRDEIRSGNLEAGERLPSTRMLAASLHVARTTTEYAYSQLLSEGYIRAREKSGYYVNEIENLSELHFGQNREDLSAWEGDPVAPLTRVGRAAEARDRESGMIDFSLRHTEMSAFPYSTWKRIMREVMVDANSEMFSHSEPGGDRALRVTIAHYLHFSRGVRCTPDQVIVGAGNDYLLMLLRHILGEGRRVAMESPSYLRAAQIFDSFGYRLCPVRMDGDGMVPESVARSGADLVYAMPAHQFPVGCVMPVGRRAALLGWAMEKDGRYIIEDDYDSEFRYRGKPIPALQSLDHAGRVIYLGTFSKVIAPAIRISYMILPPALLARYREKCWFFSSTVSRIDQRILNEFMKDGYFERHLNRMRSLYRTRHDLLLACLRPFQDSFRIRGAGAGLHLVLEVLPESPLMEGLMKGLEEGNGSRKQGNIGLERLIAARAREAGVILYCMSDYVLSALPAAGQDPADRRGTPGPGPRRPALLLGFGALDECQIREGVRRLGEALDLPAPDTQG